MVKICILCGIMARRTNAAWGHVEGGYLEKTLRMKTCSKCLVAKEESEFSGRLTHCKPCRASIERQRRVDNAEEIRRKDRARGKLRTKESRRQYYEANKDACIARSKRCYARRKSLGIKPPKWVPKDARSKIRTILRDRIKSLPKDNRCGGHWLRLVGAQPGSKIARPIVILSKFTISIFPFSNFLVSSGEESKFFFCIFDEDESILLIILSTLL